MKVGGDREVAADVARRLVHAAINRHIRSASSVTSLEQRVTERLRSRVASEDLTIRPSDS